MTMALEGIRVLDLTVGQQGPYATVMLADMGAEVIKVENPRSSGDSSRGMRRILGQHVEVKGVNSYYETHNRNKKSVTVNLTRGKGKEIIYRLATKSDVFVQNFRVGATERMGVGYEDIRKVNPRIIYAHASGFGPRGPEREKRSIDPIAQARGGIMGVTGEPTEPPVLIPAGIGDQVGAMLLAYGIVTALFARERLGVGQRVDTSLLGSQVALQGFHLQGYLLSGHIPGKVSRKDMSPTYNSYQTKDGRWIMVALMQQRYWPRLCRALDMGELENDPRFNSLDARLANGKELIAALDRIFATRIATEWLERLTENEVMHGLVQNYAEVASDAQVLENEYIVDFNHPVAGPIKIVGIPVKLSETPGQIREAAPELGAHTEEVLLDVGGYSWDDITHFRDEGLI